MVSMGEDVDDILDAVHDMLELVTKETKKNEPCATNTINCLEIAAHEVWNLSTYL